MAKKMKGGKTVAGKKYAAADEEYEEKMEKKMLSKKKPAGIAKAMSKAKEGYSKKPKVKPSKKMC